MNPSEAFSALPPWFTYLIVIALGLIVGSFLNVVIARLPKGESVVRPPSHCPGCNVPIRAWQNIPVLSYLLLRGKCAGCKTPISVRYPLVEVLTALLFFAARERYGWDPVLFIRGFPFIAILVAVTFIDLDHRIIPDRLSLGGLGLGLVTAWFDPELTVLKSLIGAGVGFSVFFSVAWIYQSLTGKAGMGGGDIKLLAMLGSFLGPFGVLQTILVSSISGSLIGLSWALYQRRQQPKALEGAADGPERLLSVAIPYGPFLVIGGLYYYLLGDLIWLRFMTPT